MRKQAESVTTVSYTHLDVYKRQTSSCRVIFGEADFLPGLVVDKYEDVLVVECLALGMEQFKAVSYTHLDVYKRQSQK